MPRHDDMPRFRDDLQDTTPRSGGPGAQTVGRVKLNTCDLDEEGFSQATTWAAPEDRAKPIFNSVAAEHASQLAGTADTLAMQARANEERRLVQAGEKKAEPVTRTDEVLVDEKDHRITRSNDGTVRCDLIGLPTK